MMSRATDAPASRSRRASDSAAVLSRVKSMMKTSGPDSATAMPCASITERTRDRKSTRLNSSHDQISYAVFCLKKKKKHETSKIKANGREAQDARGDIIRALENVNRMPTVTHKINPICCTSTTMYRPQVLSPTV